MILILCFTFKNRAKVQQKNELCKYFCKKISPTLFLCNKSNGCNNFEDKKKINLYISNKSSTFVVVFAP